VTIEAQVTAQTGRCRNCGFDLTRLPAAKFCPECGQETDRSPPTFREFIQHFFGNYISVKGSFLQTIGRLVSRPGQLTKDYLDGRKRAYILPFRLYLTVSVISFLVFGLLASQGMQATMTSESKIDPTTFKSGNIISFGNDRQVRFDNGKIDCVNVPDWLCQRAKKKFGSVDAFKQLIETLPERMIRYWAYAMFALVPLFALLLKLVYVRRGMTYGSHIVFALHLHAFWLLAILASLTHQFVTAVATVAIPVYAIVALRRVYGGGWFKTFGKALVISLLYLFAAAIAVGVVALIALLV
jgi:Protein of unknown function (DUF3667)